MNRHVFASCLILWMAITPVRASAQDAHPSSATAAPAPCKPADELFNQGKFEEAATRYDAVLKLNNQLECAQLGIAKTLVAQGDTAMAQNTINAALEAHLGSPALLQALGDIDFRRGEMGDAERAYQAALRADSKNAKSYLGLARLYRAFSLYGHAYAAIKQAHELDPNDPDVLFLWIETLPRRERLPALKDYLDGAHRDIDREQRADMERYLQYLEKTQDQPHSCLPSDRTEKTELKFKNIREAGPLIGGNKVGYALEIKVNDRTQLLQFDTGAGGMTVSRKAAEKAGLQRVSEIVFSGIGDQGDRTGYLAVAERVKLGDLEFRDCLVTVSDKKLAPDSDGLLGSDIFASYLIDLDMPHNLIRLGPLPQRPGERAPASSLNTNGGSESPRGYDAAGNSSPLPQDRYVAPEMSSWTRFFVSAI